MAMPDRFERLIVMNTIIADGSIPLGEGFAEWRTFNRAQPDLQLDAFMAHAVPSLAPEEAAAYAAPFPDATYKAGVRALPDLVPLTPDAPGADTSRRARIFWRSRWTGRSFMAIGALDPVIPARSMERLRRDIRGCPAPMRIGVGHFVQESGGAIAQAALRAFGSVPD